ncbi:MAG TPA: MBL fold metallo-hydrolase [Bryobacteraceae bacterium]|nr:MBL fold metallo-hydrolase [Bryobacteraceae bacterium]
MNRRLLARVAAAALFALVTWVAYTQNQNQPAQLKVNKVHDDLYEIEGDGGNVAVLVTNEGVILVDDKYERDHDGVVAAIKSVTAQPVKYVFSTHYHEDHSGGNGKFLPTSEIISTKNARINILEHKQSNASGNVQPARVVFTDETSAFLGGKEVRAHYFGRGHTNGDAVIYFPELRTIHTGDLMAGTSPLIDYPGGGSLAEWPKTLDNAMAAWDFDTVIPGHGNVTNKAGLKTYRDNVEKLRNRAQSLIRGGKSQQELADAMTKEYGWAANSLQQQWSVPGMMKELK